MFSNGKSLAQLLRNPDVFYDDLPQVGVDLEEDVQRQVEIEVKYAGYIKREKERINTAKKQEDQVIPTNFDYDAVKSMRSEAREKLKKIKPENLGQAARISGVNPSDISILGMWLSRDVK